MKKLPLQKPQPGGQEEIYMISNKSRNKGKWLLGLFLISIALVMAWLLQGSISPEIDFSGIYTFVDAKQKHTSMSNQVIADNSYDPNQKSVYKAKIDSAYLTTITQLLENRRTEIASQQTSFENKLKDLQLLLEDHNGNKLLLQNPMMSELENAEGRIRNDISSYNFELLWQRRQNELVKAVQQFVDKNGSRLVGTTTISSNQIDVIDSLLLKSEEKVREMKYTVNVDRVYGGLVSRKRFFGTCEWMVRCTMGQVTPEIFQLQNSCYQDVALDN